MSRRCCASARRPPRIGSGFEKLTHDASDVTTLLEGTADLLHSLSHHAGVVTTPAPSADPVRRVEFVRLRENRVLAVFVSGAGIVTNKLVQLDFAMDAGELERAANYLNEKLRAAVESTGALAAVRERILEDLRADHSDLQSLLAKALALAEQTFAGAQAEERVFVEGESSFLDAPEFREVQKARTLLRTFAEKDRILRVLDRVLRAHEVQIFIGAESEFAGIADVSVVAAPYGRGERARDARRGRADAHGLRAGDPARRRDGPRDLTGALGDLRGLRAKPGSPCLSGACRVPNPCDRMFLRAASGRAPARPQCRPSTPRAASRPRFHPT